MAETYPTFGPPFAVSLSCSPSLSLSSTWCFLAVSVRWICADGLLQLGSATGTERAAPAILGCLEAFVARNGCPFFPRQTCRVCEFFQVSAGALSKADAKRGLPVSLSRVACFPFRSNRTTRTRESPCHVYLTFHTFKWTQCTTAAVADVGWCIAFSSHEGCLFRNLSQC